MSEAPGDDTYEAPQVTDLGSLAELTQSKNKIGAATDIYSANTPLVGSLVNYP